MYANIVYVDTLKPTRRTRRWPFLEACHLMCEPGEVNALHRFAAEIGMIKTWFQDHRRMPHYDLTMARRQMAVKHGAVAVDGAGVKALLGRWRKSRKP